MGGLLLVDVGQVTHPPAYAELGVLGFDGTHDVARLALLVGLAMTATRARR
ncbi:MAG: hypothetical protein J2P22_02905 [Nocardioides sp.]|nr:hypothetical protein [Nocardioides sp.]